MIIRYLVWNLFFIEQRQTYVSEIIYPQVIKKIITIRENQPMFIFPEH